MSYNELITLKMLEMKEKEEMEKRLQVRKAKTIHKLRETLVENMRDENLSTNQVLGLSFAKDILDYIVGFPDTIGNQWVYDLVDGKHLEPFVSTENTEN